MPISTSMGIISKFLFKFITMAGKIYWTGNQSLKKLRFIQVPERCSLYLKKKRVNSRSLIISCKIDSKKKKKGFYREVVHKKVLEEINERNSCKGSY